MGPTVPETPDQEPGSQEQASEGKAQAPGCTLAASGGREGEPRTFASALPESPRYSGGTQGEIHEGVNSEPENDKWPPQPAGLLSCLLHFLCSALIFHLAHESCGTQAGVPVRGPTCPSSCTGEERSCKPES